jgi:glycosyltransferase involved in cell wall biosynthesis
VLLSAIVPVFNELKVVSLMLERLRDTLRDVTWEVIFVDDGSTEDTPNILAREGLRDDRVRLLRFSRNFGHQPAVTAGLDFAIGDAGVVMDADLQDPPELLPRMLGLFQQGYYVVSPYQPLADVRA